MHFDSRVARPIILNLVKSRVIRGNIKCFSRFVTTTSARSYTNENIAHSGANPAVSRTEVENSSLYVNPICMQLDQLMYSCSSHEELLNLLVTHRGAMYLHNLVTVMKLLREFVKNEDDKRYKPDCDDLYMGYKNIEEKKTEKDEPSIDYSQFTEKEKEVIKKAKLEVIRHLKDPRNKEYLEVKNHGRDLRDAIVRDERYDLLLQDLYVNKNKLDLVSICNVIITLDVLRHKYYRLYNGLLKRLMNMEISFDQKSPSYINEVGILLLKTCNCYARSGFYDIPLYNNVANELFRVNLTQLLRDPEHHQLFSHMIKLYGSVNTYDFGVFWRISETVEKVKLPPEDLTGLAATFSKHRNFHKIHDKVLYLVAERITSEPRDFTLKQLCSCISSFSKMRLYFKEVWRICTDRLIDELENSLSGLDDIELEVKELCSAVESITTVDNSSELAHNLVDKASLYLENRIDSIDEEDAINMAMSVLSVHSSLKEPDLKSIKGPNESENHRDNYNYNDKYNESSEVQGKELVGLGVEKPTNLNNYLLSFLWRRIGTQVFWETEPLKVFAIWVYHMLVFPHFLHNINKRCILPCYRQWLLVYGTRTQITEEVSKIKEILSPKFKFYSKSEEIEPFKSLLESPVPVDFLVVDQKFGNKAINIVQSSVRNHYNRPMGVDLLMKGILEHFGIEVHIVDFHKWARLDTEGRTRLVESIIENDPY